MEESYSKLNSTQKIVVKLFQQLVTEYADRLHSLVQLLQQLVTECTDQVPATQPWYSLPDPQLVTESSDPVHSTLC